MSMTEEEKEEKAHDKTDLVPMEQVVKDHLQKSKILDLFGKVVDHVVNLSNSPGDFFLIIESSLLTLIQKYLEKVQGIKTKSNFSHFMTKSIGEKAIKSQGEITEYFSKLKDIDRIMKMEVDQIMETAHGTEAERKALFEQVQLLAKCLEIVKSGG